MTALQATPIRTDPRDRPLELPAGDGFSPAEHTYTSRQLLELSEAWLPLVTQSPGFEVERLAAKCPVPFVLVP